MKGKKILTLVSLACGVGIVGATFAAWAVSDQADPFGIKVSPGSITPSETEFVTLKYGSDPVYADVQNIEAGEVRLGATANLAADTSTNNTYPGKFTIKLVDQTKGEKPSGAAKLIDKLNVDVYGEFFSGVTVGNAIPAESLVGKTAVAHIPPTPGTYEDSVIFNVKTGTSQNVSVAVSLGECSAKELTDIASDVVYLQMDWGRSNTEGEVESFPLYLSVPSADIGTDNVYAYAWNGKKENGAFPGVAMTKVADGLYSYALEPEMVGKVIFSKGATADATTKIAGGEEGITIGTEVTKQTAPCYSVSTSQWIPTPDPSIEATAWYVKGTVNNWTASADWKMVKVDENHYKLEGVSLKTTDKIKVWKQDGNVWKGVDSDGYEGCTYTKDSDGNASPLKDGVYTVNYFADGQNNNFITFTAAE